MGPNRLRAETVICIGDNSFILRPSFDALARIEGALNRSIFAIMLDMSNPRTCKVSEIASVIHHGIAAGLDNPSNAPSVQAIGAHIQRVGLGPILPLVSSWLTKAVATDEALEAEAAREAKPGEAPRSP
jgi:hypothetical protein